MPVDNLQSSRWRDWTTAVLRIAFVIGMSLIVWMARTQGDEAFDHTELITGAVIGLIAALITALPAAMPSMRHAAPYLLMPVDWVFAATFVYLGAGDPVVLIAVAGTLSAAGLLRLGALWGGFHVAGVIAASLGILLYIIGAENLNDHVDTYVLPILVIFLIVIGVGGWVYAQGMKSGIERQELERITTKKAAELDEMRQHAKALTEMTEVLSDSLNFEKVLDAALDIGLLSLRSQEQQRTISIVLLFSANGRELYIANSRGLQRTDESRLFQGREGIVAQALDESAPIISSDGFKDPELRRLGGFQGIRSVLAVPLRAQYDNYGVLIYGSSQTNAFDEGHIQALHAIGVQAAISLQNAVLYDNLREEKENLIKMEEEGRKALVRDLHDLPTQTISAIAMRLRVVMRLMEMSPNEVPGELEELEKMALRATEEIRHVLFKLRPLALESQGMIAALDQLAEKMQNTYKQKVTVKIQEDVERYLDSTQQAAVFYLIEEAVNNARKYAEASLISVQAIYQNEMIAVRIADNGIGFDTAGVDEDYDQRGSFGMVNMRERAELLDGRLSIKSVPGKGTSIIVHIPLDMARIRAREAQAFNPVHSKLAARTWSQFTSKQRQ